MSPRARFALVALLIPGLAGAASLAPAKSGKRMAVALPIPASQEDPDTIFDRDIKPVVQTYCLPCHSGASASAGIKLDGFPDTKSLAKDTATWRKALRAVHERSMPPQGARRPSSERANTLVERLGPMLEQIDSAAVPRDPGRVAPRRLNRLEYNNTIRDLFGTDLRLADNFPADGGGGGGFDNNADTLFLPPVLMEKYLDAAGEVVAAIPVKRLMPFGPISVKTKTPQSVALLRKTIAHHAIRAYRRPPTGDELSRLQRLYELARSKGDDPGSALATVAKAMLVSPNFLFRTENDPGTGGNIALDNWEIASRLSYFLWSSMPDETLFALARQGKLSDPNVVAAQARRMLADPKARAFADSFAGQWLRAREVVTTAQPDPGRFPNFTSSLRNAMLEETTLFFLHVVRNNEPVRRFVDSDVTFLNEELARHYGVAGVSGSEMRLVKVDSAQRGGVLTQAAILTLTSYPQRTSPVLRGKWVLAELLGAPPPPPPPVVNTLPPDDRPQKGQTLRQRLELHREKPECKGCHERIDPLGFGLESYDAIGRWRTAVGEVPVDTAGKLLSGESFNGVAEMKQVLVRREAEITRNLAERLLAYALGRGVEPSDLPTIRRIVAAAEKDNFRTGTLVAEVVRSLPFRYRLGEKAKTASLTNRTQP